MLLKFDQVAMHCCGNPEKDDVRGGLRREERGERRGEDIGAGICLPKCR